MNTTKDLDDVTLHAGHKKALMKGLAVGADATRPSKGAKSPKKPVQKRDKNSAMGAAGKGNSGAAKSMPKVTNVKKFNGLKGKSFVDGDGGKC